MAELILPRRGFLLGLGAMLAAPAIVRIENIMPVKRPPLLVSVSDFYVEFERVANINRGDRGYIGETLREDPNVTFVPRWPRPEGYGRDFLVPYKIAVRRESLTEREIKELARGGSLYTDTIYDGIRLVQKDLKGDYTVPISSFERSHVHGGGWAYKLSHPDLVFPGYARKDEA